MESAHGMPYVNALAGHMMPTGKISIRGMWLPEFNCNWVIEEHEFLAFDTPYKYDLILGGDFWKKLGIKFHYDTMEIEWLGIKLPMNMTGFTAEQQAAFVEAYQLQME